MDDPEYLQRLMSELAAVGQRNPLHRSLSPALLMRIALDEPENRQGEERGAGPVKKDESEDAARKRLLQELLNIKEAVDGKDLDIYRILRMRGSEEEEKAEENKSKVQPVVPRFDLSLLDRYKDQISDIFDRKSPGYKEEDEDSRGKKKVGRAVLDVVLSQLLMEEDIVLHRALLHSPYFESAPNRSNSARRRSRKKSSIYTEFTQEQIKDVVNSIHQLIDESDLSQSATGYLIVAKALLCLYQAFLREEAVGQSEDVDLGLSFTSLEKMVLPSQTDLLQLAQHGFDLVNGLSLGQRISKSLLSDVDSSSLESTTFSTYGTIIGPDENLEQEQQKEKVVDLEVSSPPVVTSKASKKKMNKHKSKGGRPKRVNSSNISTSPPSAKSDGEQGNEEADDQPGSSIEQQLHAGFGALALLNGRRVVIDQASMSVETRREMLVGPLQDDTVEHVDFKCDGCEDSGPLCGTRFQCANCEGFDFCLPCFKEGKHDMTHPFWMHFQGSKVLIPPRDFAPFSVVGFPCLVVRGSKEKKKHCFFEVQIQSECNMETPMSDIRVGFASHLVEWEPAGNLGDTKFTYAAKFQDLIKHGDVIGCWIENEMVCFSINGVPCEETRNVRLGDDKEEMIETFFPCASFLSPYIYEESKLSQSEENEEEHDEKEARERGSVDEITEKWKTRLKFKSMDSFREFATPAGLRVPRIPGSGMVFHENILYQNPFKLHEDYTFDAMIFWDPIDFGTTSSAENMYVIMSRQHTKELKSTNASPVTCFGVVGDGHLFLKRQNSETISFTKSIVITPRQWHHVGVTYYGGSYRSSAITFLVDGNAIRSESKKRRSGGTYSSTTGRYRSVAETMPRIIRGSTRASNANNSAGDSTYETNWGVGGELVDNRLDLIHQFSGLIVEARVWKRGISAREINHFRGRVQDIESMMSRFLLFRFRFDEGSGKVSYMEQGKIFLEQHCNIARIIGAARMDREFIHAEMTKIANVQGPSSSSIDPKDGGAPSSPSSLKGDSSQSHEIFKLVIELKKRGRNLRMRKYSAGANLLTVFGHLIRLVNSYEDYMVKEDRGVGIGIFMTPPLTAIKPNVLTLLLLHSLLRQCVEVLRLQSTASPTVVVLWVIYSCCKLIRTNIAMLKKMEISPASVGLGPSPIGNHDEEDPSALSGSNVIKLRKLLLSISNHDFGLKSSSLKSAIDSEILRVLSDGADVFFPYPFEQRRLLTSLLNKPPQYSSSNGGGGGIGDSPVIREKFCAMLCTAYTKDDQLFETLWAEPIERELDPLGSSSQRLKWTTSYVTASLSTKQHFSTESITALAANEILVVQNGLTKRTVIRYMQQVAPTEWLAERGLDQNEMVVTKNFSSEQIGQFYSELETDAANQEFALAPHDKEEAEIAQNAIPSRPTKKEKEKKKKKNGPMEPLPFAKRLLDYLLSLDQEKETEVRDAVLGLLKRVQLHIQVQQKPVLADDGPSSSSTTTPSGRSTPVRKQASPDDEAAFGLEVFLWTMKGRELLPREEQQTTIVQEKELETEPEVETSTPKDHKTNRKWWLKQDIQFSEDKSMFEAGLLGGFNATGSVNLDTSFCSRYVSLSKDSQTVVHERNKSWGTCMSQQGYARNSGVWKWHVKINQCNPKGHMFVGVAVHGTRIDSYLGNDRKGLGILLAGDIYYDAQAKHRSMFPKSIFTTGSIIEVTLNTDECTLKLHDTTNSLIADGQLEFEVPDQLYEAAPDGLIYPAVCTYEQGDSLTLLAHSTSNPGGGHWLFENKSEDQAACKPFQEYVLFLLEFVEQHCCVEGKLQDKSLRRKLLSPPLATVLLWPKYDPEWITNVRPIVQRLLLHFASPAASASEEISEEVVLLSIFMSRICAAMITCDPVDLEKGPEGGDPEGEVVLKRWTTSPLFYRGLAPSRCVFASMEEISVSDNNNHNNSDNANLVVLHPHEHKDEHLAQTSELPRLVRDMVNEQGAGKVLIEWVSRHMNIHPNSIHSFGSPDIVKATNALIAVLLYHSGWLPIALHIATDLHKTPKQQLVARPDRHFLDIWRAAMEMKAWLVRYDKDGNDDEGGEPGLVVARLAFRCATLLFDFCPSTVLPDEEIQQVLENFKMEIGEATTTTTPSSSMQKKEKRLGTGSKLVPSLSGLGLDPNFRKLLRSSSASSVRSMLPQRSHQPKKGPSFQSVLNEISAFVQDMVGGKLTKTNTPLMRLHVRLLAIRACGLQRREGFRCLTNLLTKIPFSNHNIPFHGALLSMIPSALRNWSLVGPSSAVSEKASSPILWHYLHGLESCNPDILTSVSEQFAELGKALADMLHATSAVSAARAKSGGGGGTAGLQLLLLDSWGICLEPVDHELLSRTNLLETLHRIMEVSRDAISSNEEDIDEHADDGYEEGNGTIDVGRQGVMEMQIVGRAAMNAFYLLCSQVAVASSHPVERVSYGPRSGYSLIRMRSGPESLNTSVYNLLYQELKIASEQIREDMVLFFPDENSKREYQDNKTDDGQKCKDELFLMEAQHHAREITSLLLSICSSTNCKQQIVSGSWLSLLCELARSGPHIVRCNVFKLFRRILPELDPELVSIEVQGLEEENIINFFFRLITRVFVPCENIEMKNSPVFAIACEAAHTVYHLLGASKWSKFVVANLCDGLNRADAALRHMNLDVETDQEEDLDDEEDLNDKHEDYIKKHLLHAKLEANTPYSSDLAKGIGCLAIISKSLAKLLPGGSVLIVHQNNTNCASEGTVSCQVKEDVVWGDTITVQSTFGTEPVQNMTVLSQQVIPTMTNELLDMKNRDFKSLQESIVNFHKSLVEIYPLARPSCASKFYIPPLGGHSDGKIDVFNRNPYECSKQRKIGSIKHGTIVTVSERVGSWLKLHERQKFDRTDNGKSQNAWILLQDPEDDYILAPIFDKEKLGESSQIHIGITYSLSALNQLMDDSLVDLLLQNMDLVESILTFSLDTIPEVGIAEGPFWEERLSMILEEAYHALNFSERKSQSEAKKSKLDEKKRAASPAKDAESGKGQNLKGSTKAGTVTATSSSSTTTANDQQQTENTISEAVLQIMEMGFPRRWAEFALERTGDVTAAVTYICSNGDVLDERIHLAQAAHGASSNSGGHHDEYSEDHDEDGEEEEEEDDGHEDVECDDGDDLTQGSDGEDANDKYNYGSKEKEDYLEMEGVDMGDLADSLMDNRAPDVRNRITSLLDGGTNTKDRGTYGISAKAKSVFLKTVACCFGPCADSRGSYRDLVGSYGVNELYEELNHVGRVMGIITSRQLILRVLRELANSGTLSDRILGKMSPELQKLTVKFIVSEGFTPYPFYALHWLVDFCGHEQFSHENSYSIPKTIGSFVSKALEISPVMVTTFLEYIRSQIQLGMSADLLIDRHLNSSSNTMYHSNLMAVIMNATSPSANLSLWFVHWATEKLLLLQDRKDLHFKLYESWLDALRSPSARLKLEAFKVLEGLLEGAQGDGDLMGRMFDIMPMQRLQALASRLLWKDCDDTAGYSSYVRACVEFVTKLTYFQQHYVPKKADAQEIGTALSMTSPESFVELRECSGQTPLPVRTPWTAMFWLTQASDSTTTTTTTSSSSSSLSEEEKETTNKKQVLFGSSKGVKLLTKTTKGGFVGLETADGKEHSFGYRLPSNEPVVLSFVSIRLPPLVGSGSSVRKSSTRTSKKKSVSKSIEDDWEKIGQGGKGGKKEDEDDDTGTRHDDEDEDDEDEENEEEVEDEDEEEEEEEEEDGDHDEDDDEEFNDEDFVVDVDAVMDGYVQFIDLSKQIRKLSSKKKNNKHNGKFKINQDVLVRLFVNDRIVGSCTISESQVDLGQCEIGRTSTQESSFLGNITKVCVWNSPMDRADLGKVLQTSYSFAVNDPRFDSLLAYWDFSNARGSIVTEIATNQYMAVLRGGAEIVKSEVPKPGQQTVNNLLQQLRNVDNGNTALHDSSTLMKQLQEGMSLTGVLIWDLDDPSLNPGLFDRVVIPYDYRSAYQPIKLRILFNDETMTTFHGLLEIDDCSKASCLVKGTRKNNNDKVCSDEGGESELRFDVVEVICGRPKSRTWLSKLKFEGTESNGELNGQWSVQVPMKFLPEDHQSTMHFVPRWSSPIIELNRAATEARIGVINYERFHDNLPPFVIQGQRKVPEWVVLVANMPGFPTHESELISQTYDGKDDDTDEDQATEASQSEGPKTWSCPACTFANEMEHLSCAICSTANPDPPGNGSTGKSGDNEEDGNGPIMNSPGIINTNPGRYLWEFEVNMESGVSYLGVCSEGASLRKCIGEDPHAWTISTSGGRWHDGGCDTFLPSKLSKGDILGMELNTMTQELRVLVNGKDLGVVFTRDDGLLMDGPVSPCVCLRTRDLALSGSIIIKGTKDGKGAIEYGQDREENLESFTGTWVQGCRQGLGKLLYRDGTIEYGYWDRGLKHGPCLRVQPDGKSSLIHYEDDLESSSSTECSATEKEALEELRSKDVAEEVSVNLEVIHDDENNDNDRDQYVRVNGKLCCSRHSLFVLDPSTAGPGVQVAPDCMSAEYIASGKESGRRSCVLGNRGFSSGVHYWEVKVQGMQWGSTYIGISERLKHNTKSQGSGWGNGFGFVNYRATHGPDGEQLYGSFYAVGDVVGVLLDMDRGRLCFFKDGKDFHGGDRQTMIDLGLAYSGIRRRFASSYNNFNPVFYPCLGFAKTRDKLSLQGTRQVSVSRLGRSLKLHDTIQTARICSLFGNRLDPTENDDGEDESRKTILGEAMGIWNRWYLPGKQRKKIYWTLGDIPVELSDDPGRCRELSGGSLNLVPGDRVSTERGEAEILGTRQDCIWYQVDGMEFCMFWSPSELTSLCKEKKIELVHREKKNDDKANKILPNINESTLSKALSAFSLKDDEMVVFTVNKCCDKLSCEPEQLPLYMLHGFLYSHPGQNGQGVEFQQEKNGLIQNYSWEMIVGRMLILLAINIRVRRLLPVVDTNDCNNWKTYGKGRSGSSSMRFIKSEEANVKRRNGQREEDFHTESVGQLLRRIRGIIFTRVKLAFWEDQLELTTTPTVPAADEYDVPPDFPEVRINRIRAGEHRLRALPPNERLRRSVFGQLMIDGGLGTWNPLRLRKSYSHIQDAQQKRCFFVKFESEGVDDHGGPYRAVFQIAIEEEATGPLQLLVPCANAAEGAMQNMDKLVFNTVPIIDSDSKDDTGTTGKGINVLECVQFLGRLLGIAIRHKIHVGISLPSFMWRSLVGLGIGWKELHEVDTFTTRSLRHFEMLAKEEWDESAETWTELLMDKLGEQESQYVSETLLRKSEDGVDILPYEHRCQVTEMIVEQYLMEQAPYLDALKTGIADAIPVDSWNMFTPNELEVLVCGEPEIDIELLKRATIYEDVDPEAPHVKYFWEALEEMSQEERSKFINFTCARSRLPASVDKFPMSFRILPPMNNSNNNNTSSNDDIDDKDKDKENDDNADQDMALPHSQTCFFSLSLPKYSSKQVCLEKLIYACNNCNTMEDFDVHDAHGFEGM